MCADALLLVNTDDECDEGDDLNIINAYGIGADYDTDNDDYIQLAFDQDQEKKEEDLLKASKAAKKAARKAAKRLVTQTDTKAAIKADKADKQAGKKAKQTDTTDKTDKIDVIKKHGSRGKLTAVQGKSRSRIESNKLTDGGGGSEEEEEDKEVAKTRGRGRRRVKAVAKGKGEKEQQQGEGSEKAGKKEMGNTGPGAQERKLKSPLTCGLLGHSVNDHTRVKEKDNTLEEEEENDSESDSEYTDDSSSFTHSSDDEVWLDVHPNKTTKCKNKKAKQPDMSSVWSEHAKHVSLHPVAQPIGPPAAVWSEHAKQVSLHVPTDIVAQTSQENAESQKKLGFSLFRWGSKRGLNL